MFLRNLYLRINLFCTVCILFHTPFVLYSQTVKTIKGAVINDKGLLMPNANIILKTSDGIIIAYKVTNEQGQFIIDINPQENEYLLEASMLGYNKTSIVISSKYNFAETIYLKMNPSQVQLEEVKIISRPIPIKINNDTTTYNIDNFLKGDEDVLEDVLKKLPGIEVSESGRVTFKGKPISKLLIEGDDLFDKKYQVGTKNIKVAIINQVEAIENYVANKKMVGLQQEKEVVLNLKVKDDAKVKPNLTSSLALGYHNRYETEQNLIGIKKNLKYFVFWSFPRKKESHISLAISSNK